MSNRETTGPGPAYVKTHINIYGKLGAGSRTQAVAQARAIGLVT